MAFKTYITFADRTTHVEDTSESEIQNTIMRLCRGPAAISGMIKEVKIVDTWDCIVFLSRGGKIIFPTKEDCDKALRAG